MPSQVELLAHDVLDERELRLAARLSLLLGDPERDAASLIEEILPIYSEKHGSATRVLTPDPMYRPLYYVHNYAEQRVFGRHTEAFVDAICNHLEGCLEWLTPHPPKSRHPNGPFGNLVVQLYKAGTLTRPSADQLARFNKVVNVSPTKRFTPRLTSNSNPGVKVFSTLDAALAFVMMRKLSIQLFDVLRAKGVNLPQGWKGFREEWLQWDRARPTSASNPARGNESPSHLS